MNNKEAIAQQLIALGSATVYEAQGAFGALDAGIKPICADMKLAGPAFTVDMRPADNLMIHYALLHAQPGDVLVIDCKGFIEAGVWGDVLTTQALKIGLAGIVVNGAVRDADAIAHLGFPVFSRGLSIKGTGKTQPGRVNVPVTIGDVTVSPGDIVIGDRDGVAIVPASSAERTLELALARESKEGAFKEKIAQGATTAELMNLSETFRLLNLQ
ncbi:demethylmenaquinone methyltransferase [Leminorella grimontii]|uniref:Putative 4-hydroxy-4-methyl-2-oxoglutarate aldolase n=1 Tax=Leminorella grimontii TaxID=82981 RepID=A0AAV5N214_9GAMM|nr:4-carboxy-4-hydroxy-2-oxoadipate aldolase/oxaloacetate decarboxylase [Leminorella grimontii]KFC96327.1 demethylmenaquinone methyltransferase [Leminorella grimontii ATCC 33999 = DSM 5078]GKX54482.1 demethylmenaquinone methyltransferase [Leminorella grimontii]VFS59142.1 4-hydroxy-2-oxoglutarate aldolase [Leminorella grimontii]